jgi:hypothetical protein
MCFIIKTQYQYFFEKTYIYIYILFCLELELGANFGSTELFLVRLVPHIC